MYALRPIVTPADAGPRAKIMYEMRNIHEDEPRWRQEGVRRHRARDDAERAPRDDAKMPSDVVTEQSPLQEFGTLETRQEEILSQLAELKKQVSTLRNFLKQPSLENAGEKPHSGGMCKERTAKDCAPREAVNINLVVNADPSSPPYSIYALQKLWKDTNIKVETHVHSTVVNLVPVTFNSSIHPDPRNVIKVSLIYKNVEDLETVTCLHSYPIIGEVNFLRYLSRLIDTHNYESNYDAALVHATDGVLDSCCRVRRQASRDETDRALSALHDRLKQTHWTGENEPSIADIAAWSTIKQFSSAKMVPRFLREWYERCEKVFMDGVSKS